MAFFKRIKKTFILTFILTALMTLSVNAYDVKGGEVKVGSSLNLRAEADASATVVTQIPNTHRVAFWMPSRAGIRSLTMARTAMSAPTMLSFPTL